MLVKTSELSGAALDWAVAKCEGEIFKSAPTVDPQISKVWPLTGLARVENGQRIGYAIDDSLLKRTQLSYANEGGFYLYVPVWQPSSTWAQGGPIIEREKITILHVDDNDIEPLDEGNWCAGTPNADVGYTGITPLIAAMRCFVASKLGDNVEIPEELL